MVIEMQDLAAGRKVQLPEFRIESGKRISMDLKRNPFRYGADFDPNDVVGRKDEITRAARAIRDGQRLFLIGPRGYGKTSILLAAQAKLSQEGAIVLYVNAEASPDVGTLVGEIVAGAAAQVFEGAEDGIQKASRFFSHLVPTFTLSAVEQAISVSIGTDLLASKYRQIATLNRCPQKLVDTSRQDSPDQIKRGIPHAYSK
jgi:energy-coupling factor transporter ATP-binding protein EcfA2